MGLLTNLPYRPSGNDERSVAGIEADFDYLINWANGGIDNDNIAAGADIDYDKLNIPPGAIDLSRLEHGTPGQLAIVQADGSVAYKTVSGDAAIDEDGVVTVPFPTIPADTAERYGLIHRAGPSPFVTTNSTGFWLIGGPNMSKSGLDGPADTAQRPDLLNYVNNDYTVAGMTKKMRLRGLIEIGTGIPAITNVVIDLRPITISAGLFSAGAQVSGSAATVLNAAMTANTIVKFDSGDFTPPADGTYAICFTPASTPIGANIQVQAQLLIHSV